MGLLLSLGDWAKVIESIHIYPQDGPITLAQSPKDTSVSDVSPPLYVDFAPPPYAFTPEIKGSCRGILFLHGRLKFTLWNPSTGFRKQIPASPFNSETCSLSKLYGFGYDHSRDDYLLVTFSCERTLVNPSSHLELFSFRNNRWEEIDGNYGLYYNCTSIDLKGGSLCNGAIHWLTSRSYDFLEFPVDVILAFDLLERQPVEMPLPDHNPRTRDIWIFGEFFSLWTMYNDTFKVFVMKEYKVHSSWTQTLVLRIDGVPTKNFYPVCCTKNGDIIATVNDGTELVKLNDEGMLLGNHTYGDQPFMFQVVMYTESLLSLPDGDGE
ncbi:F-box/kelch-repeat protein At3g06240-like [Vicia villosa]|uniref:F-box/kelch-repeat protein At3g06240-like n=1 Tax=Vicia villosa TaxID=3911 RepID=UPI00273B5242|nr:F-box/kelch-repeat protein At3g06240-like [Vicia villosa]